MVLFLAIGSVCAADLNADDCNVNSEILNSEDINSNEVNTYSGIDNSSLNTVSVSSANLDSSNSDSDSNANLAVSDVNLDNNESNVITANNIDNLSTTTLTATKTVTISAVVTASVNVVKYVNSYKKLPTTVKVGSYTVTAAQFSYLAEMAVQYIKSGKTTVKIAIPTYSARNSTGDEVKITLSASTAISYAKVITTYATKNKVLPGVVNVSGKKVEFKVYTYAFATMLKYYYTYKKLPSSVLFTSAVFNNTPTPVVTTVTVAQIVAASVNVNKYVGTNKTLPSTVTVGGVKVSVAQFAYLESAAIKLLNSKSAVTTKVQVINVTNGSATYDVKKTLAWSYCLNLANNVYSVCASNHVAPNYVTISSAKIDFRDYTYGFSKILTYYNSYKKLPSSCLFDSSVFKTTPVAITVTVSQVITAASNVKDFVEENSRLPSTVTVGGKVYSIAQFSYLQSEAIKLLNNGKAISSKITVINVTNKSVEYDFSKSLAKSAYVSWATSLSKYCVSNGVTPNYMLSGSDKADFRTYTFGFSKILAFYKTYSRLPDSCTFDSSVFDDVKKYQRGVNEINTETSLSKYLVTSGHCALNTQIKNLATSLTKDCSSTLEKANAIFTYVRDKVSYSFYYNSVKDASGALSSKSANCCDKSNLIVALCRAAGIYSRYCHGTCTFSSGLRVGHVWTQILVGNVWYVADATSSRNKLGEVNNWNTNSLSGLEQMALLTF